MTNPPDPTTHRLARALNALRPEWPIASLETLLRNETLRNRAAPDIAIAATRLAMDPDCRTPGLLLRHGHWWITTYAGQADHNRPTPPPIDQLQLGDPNPAPAERTAAHIAAARENLRQLRHKRGQAIPPEIRTTMVGTG